FLLPQSPGSTLFPYTTLFRSRAVRFSSVARGFSRSISACLTRRISSRRFIRSYELISKTPCHHLLACDWEKWLSSRPSNKEKQRSEEHTSELQSLRHLVCRLL